MTKGYWIYDENAEGCARFVRTGFNWGLLSALAYAVGVWCLVAFLAWRRFG